MPILLKWIIIITNEHPYTLRMTITSRPMASLTHSYICALFALRTHHLWPSAQIFFPHISIKWLKVNKTSWKVPHRHRHEKTDKTNLNKKMFLKVLISEYEPFCRFWISHILYPQEPHKTYSRKVHYPITAYIFVRGRIRTWTQLVQNFRLI